MITHLGEALANPKPKSDQVNYSIIKLPKEAIIAASGIVAEIGESFVALILDDHELTLIIPSDALEDYARRMPGNKVSSETYKLITLDIELDLSVVGLMASISRALAGAGIPIFPLAAYSRDHLLVPAEHLEKAMQVLVELNSSE
jgi:hypothetical protein